MLAMSALSGRGTVAMWGYPLWLFLDLWIVLTARRAIEGVRLTRLLAIWGIVFTCLGAAFIVNSVARLSAARKLRRVRSFRAGAAAAAR